MKKMLVFVLLLSSVLSFAQEFQFSEDFEAKNVTCIEKAGYYFTLFSEYDKKDKAYYITLFALEDDVNVKKGVYKTKDRLELASYHVYQNQLILVLSFDKKNKFSGIRSAKGKRNTNVKSSSSKYKEERYEIVAFDLDKNEVKNSSQSFYKPDYKFSTDSKTILLGFHSNKITLTSISDNENYKTSNFDFTNKEKYSISSNIKDGLKVVNNDVYNEGIGVSEPRLFYTDDAIYITRDGYKFKKQSIIYKVSLADGLIKNIEEKSIEYPYGKAVKDLNSYLINDKYYLITRYKSELNLQIASLDSIDKPVKNICLKDYEDKAVWIRGDVERLARKLTNIITPKVPSLMIYDLEDSDKKLVVVDDILKNTYYFNNSFHWQFHQQMMQQQQRAMQQQMMQYQQRAMQQMQSMKMSMPGGFYVFELPLMVPGLEVENVKLEFLINGENEVSKYNNEEICLKKYDYDIDIAFEELKKKISVKVKKYKEKFVSITFINKYKIQYAYFDKYENRLLTGVLGLKKED